MNSATAGRLLVLATNLESNSRSRIRRNTLGSLLWSMWLRFPHRIRRRLYRFLFFFSRPSCSVLKLPFGLYAKVGGDSVLQEALSLQFVADCTTIPVPQVLDLISADSVIMLMSHVHGMPVSSLDTLTEEQQTLIADTLRDWLNQLQYLRSPHGRVLCGYLGGSFTSYRIHRTCFVGPFQSQNRFHEHPCCAITSSHDPKVSSLAAIIRQKRYDISFVHGNVSPENVLINNKGIPIGLIGWECSAWMPSYWDLTAGSWSARGRMGETVWSHILIRCLPQYTDELIVDKELCKTYSTY